jgi:hypothetical protein
MKKISRRNVLVGAATTVGCLVVPRIFGTEALSSSALAWSPARLDLFEDKIADPVCSFDDASLATKAVLDPSSWPLLDKLFPGFRSTESFQHLGGSSYLVTNTGRKAVRAFSTDWSVTANSTVKTKVNLHYFRPRGQRKPKMHWGVTGNKTRFTAKVPVLKAGASKLVSPYFAIAPGFYEKNGESLWNKLADPRYRSTFPVSPAKLAASSAVVKMTIDAYVTRNFHVVGPDRANLSRIISVTRNAERDEGISIWALLQKGASPQEIRQTLLGHASGLAFDITPDGDLYYRVRQRQAKVLLRRLKKAPWDKFGRTIVYLKNQPETKIKRA